jgi:hypothetical protein
VRRWLLNAHTQAIFQPARKTGIPALIELNRFAPHELYRRWRPAISGFATFACHRQGQGSRPTFTGTEALPSDAARRTLESRTPEANPGRANQRCISGLPRARARVKPPIRPPRLRLPRQRRLHKTPLPTYRLAMRNRTASPNPQPMRNGVQRAPEDAHFNVVRDVPIHDANTHENGIAVEVQPGVCKRVLNLTVF